MNSENQSDPEETSVNLTPIDSNIIPQDLLVDILVVLESCSKRKKISKKDLQEYLTSKKNIRVQEFVIGAVSKSLMGMGGEAFHYLEILNALGVDEVISIVINGYLTGVSGFIKEADPKNVTTRAKRGNLSNSSQINSDKHVDLEEHRKKISKANVFLSIAIVIILVLILIISIILINQKSKVSRDALANAAFEGSISEEKESIKKRPNKENNKLKTSKKKSSRKDQVQKRLKPEQKNKQIESPNSTLESNKKISKNPQTEKNLNETEDKIGQKASQVLPSSPMVYKGEGFFVDFENIAFEADWNVFKRLTEKDIYGHSYHQLKAKKGSLQIPLKFLKKEGIYNVCINLPRFIPGKSSFKIQISSEFFDETHNLEDLEIEDGWALIGEFPLNVSDTIKIVFEGSDKPIFDGIRFVSLGGEIDVFGNSKPIDSENEVDSLILDNLEKGVLFLAYHDFAWFPGQKRDGLSLNVKDEIELINYPKKEISKSKVSMKLKGGGIIDFRDVSKAVISDKNFAGILSVDGCLYSNDELLLTFSGLEKNLLYDLIFYGNPGFNRRFSVKFEIEGTESFLPDTTWLETIGNTETSKFIFSPEDAVLRIRDIKIGDSGTFVVRFLSPEKSLKLFYLNCFSLTGKEK